MVAPCRDKPRADLAASVDGSYIPTGKNKRKEQAMSSVETTRMSSKGQVVIPENVRRQLGLAPGQQFVVIGDGDVIVLKSIEVPSMRDFDGMIRDARRAAKEAGMRPADIARAVDRARKR